MIITCSLRYGAQISAPHECCIYTSMKFGFSSSEHATHERRAGSQRYDFSSFRMIAAKVAQRPYRHEALDKQSAAGAAVSIVAAGNFIEFDELRKVFIWCSVVNDAERSGEVYHGVA
jgi:hypothetical protein